MVNIQGAIRTCPVCLNESIMRDDPKCKVCNAIYDGDDFDFQKKQLQQGKDFVFTDKQDEWLEFAKTVSIVVIALCAVIYLILKIL